MTSSYSTPVRRNDSNLGRERTLSMIAGALGVLMFVWGFLKWLKVGEGDNAREYGGYALSMPSTAVIGLSLAAGIIAVLGATERRSGRGVPSAIPTGLAAASALVALGILLGKGSVSPELGDKVGVQIGLILGLITALLQAIVLAAGLASRHDDGDDTVARDNTVGGTTTYAGTTRTAAPGSTTPAP